jgi:hypothetical protein
MGKRGNYEMNNTATTVDLRAYSEKADKINKAVVKISKKIHSGNIVSSNSYKNFPKNSKVKSYGL